ncbi:MAG: nitroreductase [Oceanicaulis sp.]|uniref:nitroreductase family protein n=1 Tax=unclassified Oceanicaulis TaxID=2632123 RepID=UPI000C3E8600|nr:MULTISPECIES: nitroreductase [unclassified Oceanicaulis]MAB68841.1 nitroreductase [Oceanicaulis sp.]MBC39300.1 nitroreductase [Oceanicaulis sp.]MBG35215.1 nitroreductase [Oceanicaulis sp.]HBU62355.1 nitroreductase [Oceanicaulis sp.]HCR94350.1 nitroreductase [Oceanicaulis sp.]|tara:strand:- start:1315 stop:1941 length:627 start_codon:yes stop_codon:yes gene_type:complete
MASFTAPTFPHPGDSITLSGASPETLALLAQRRSTLAKDMGEPGPSAEQLDTLLKIGARTPDHGKLFPWRFIVFEGEARAKFGERLEARFRDIEPDAPAERFELERSRFLRAPVVIAVVSDTDETHKVPEWEQILSAGAVCQNLLIAAAALGFGAQWLTEWYAFDKRMKSALGLQPGERVAGFIYVGTPQVPAQERPRKDPRVTRWEE